VPEVFVAPVSKLRLWPTERVAVELMSAKAATGNVQATAAIAVSAAIFLVSFIFKRQGTDFI
jgi:hypothetical protein